LVWLGLRGAGGGDGGKEDCAEGEGGVAQRSAT
jgi:hypothetical protein